MVLSPAAQHPAAFPRCRLPQPGSFSLVGRPSLSRANLPRHNRKLGYAGAVSAELGDSRITAVADLHSRGRTPSHLTPPMFLALKCRRVPIFGCLWGPWRDFRNITASFHKRLMRCNVESSAPATQAPFCLHPAQTRAEYPVLIALRLA